LRGITSYDVQIVKIGQAVQDVRDLKNKVKKEKKLEMWANAQPDGRPAEYK